MKILDIARRAGNLRQALSARDRTFVEAGLQPRRHSDSDTTRLPFKGFAPLHSLTLDLGDLPAGTPLRLLMHGFTDYFTANSIFAAHQANVTAVVPWVEAQLPDGTWRRIADDIGFPAGLPSGPRR